MKRPKLPYFPDELMEVVGKITPQNQESFSSLPSRSLALLQSTKAVITQELDKLFQTYSISPQSRLVTQRHHQFLNLEEEFLLQTNYFKIRIGRRSLFQLKAVWSPGPMGSRGNFSRLFSGNFPGPRTPPMVWGLWPGLLWANLWDRGGPGLNPCVCARLALGSPWERGAQPIFDIRGRGL